MNIHKFHRFWVNGLVVLAFLVCGVLPAHASEIRVVSTFEMLKAALFEADSGDVILINGSLLCKEPVQVKTHVTIQSLNNDTLYRDYSGIPLITVTDNGLLTLRSVVINSRVDFLDGEAIYVQGELNMGSQTTILGTISLQQGKLLSVSGAIGGDIALNIKDGNGVPLLPSIGSVIGRCDAGTTGVGCMYSLMDAYLVPVSVGDSVLVWRYASDFEMDAVDLDLPSHRRWATANIGTSIEWQSGSYFTWGGLAPFDLSNHDGSNCMTNWPDSLDVAYFYLGGNWHIPTKEQWQELIDNTNVFEDEVVSLSGLHVPGYRFQSKVHSNRSIFIPVSGYMTIQGAEVANRDGDKLYYWTSTFDTVNNAPVYVSVSSFFTQLADIGIPVRAVVDPMQYFVEVDSAEGGVVTGVDTGSYAVGTLLTATAEPDPGWHFVSWSDGSTENPKMVVLSSDTAFVTIFERNSYRLILMLPSGDTVTDTLIRMDDPMVEVVEPVVEGHEFVQWSPTLPDTMPMSDVVSVAVYNRKEYSVMWQGVDTIVYDGLNHAPKAYYINDFGDTISAEVFDYVSGKSVFSQAKEYTLLAIAADTNYRLSINSRHPFVIKPKKLSVVDVRVSGIKMVDGNNVAKLISTPSLVGVCQADDLSLEVKAFFSDPTVGGNKTITVLYSIKGQGIVNYTYTRDSVIADNGAILNKLEIDKQSSTGGISVDDQGYCENDYAEVSYSLLPGSNPTYYKVIFSDNAVSEGFVQDSLWRSCTDWSVSGMFGFRIPDGCQGGVYRLYLQFRNELDSVSAKIPVEFLVNESRRALKAVFTDVISVDRARLELETYQWYRDGEPIQGATLPYFQESGVLYGHTYSLVGWVNNRQVRVCPQSSFSIETSNHNYAISVFPNPASDYVTVEYDVESIDRHEVLLLDSYGNQIRSASFVGHRYQMPVSSLPSGNYMILLDGHPKRFVKR
ncbi:MAG: hypothetical protein KBT04_06345 [Bacteroidales bacterium]|nr:hypothetical protein [Candidatus Colimorpha onthohippi]